MCPVWHGCSHMESERAFRQRVCMFNLVHFLALAGGGDCGPHLQQPGCRGAVVVHSASHTPTLSAYVRELLKQSEHIAPSLQGITTLWGPPRHEDDVDVAMVSEQGIQADQETPQALQPYVNTFRNDCILIVPCELICYMCDCRIACRTALLSCRTCLRTYGGSRPYVFTCAAWSCMLLLSYLVWVAHIVLK